ncbi:MAG: Mrp/NBP35 family ATP-binding protein [Victivallales bacterium]|nr:Mrp/NBP35 family ATP-binding protein [Victivallales bacterium]
MDCKSCNSATCTAKNRQPEESAEEFAARQRLTRRMCGIKHKILVLSGKGGVGKSTVAVNVAASLAQQGFTVGLLDVDVHGPSIPTMLHLTGAGVTQSEEGIEPVMAGPNLKVISVAFFLEHPEQAVIWRGPMKMAVIKQFLGEVNWGELDYLIIDSPPGTGDEPLSVCQLIDDMEGCIMVTTPQEVASADVRRSITFCNQLAVPVLGVIENMSGFRCPKCGEVVNIFSAGGGKKLAEEMKVPFLGTIPIEPEIAGSGDNGKPYVYAFAASPTAQLFENIVAPLIAVSDQE